MILEIFSLVCYLCIAQSNFTNDMRSCLKHTLDLLLGSLAHAGILAECALNTDLSGSETLFVHKNNGQ